MSQNLPITQYDHCGYWLGVSFPWAAGIGTWHACASVLFPIAFTHHIFPEVGAKPWLNSRAALVLAIVLLLLACLVFLGKSEKGVQGTPAQLALILSLTALGFLLARSIQGNVFQPRPRSASVWAPTLTGFSVLLPFWGLVALAAAKVPVWLFSLL